MPAESAIRDTIVIEVAGKRYEHFTSYSLSSHLFEAADPFSLEIPGSADAIHKHQPCKLWVNGALELNGVIDKVNCTTDKSGTKTSVAGRDLMGVVVDAYCTEFKTIETIELKALAGQLLAPLPFINRKDIIYASGGKLGSAAAQQTEAIENIQIQPGQTVFDVLTRFATARGLIFFSRPDGTFVFGRPERSGKASFTAVMRYDGSGNNILRASRIEDGSAEFSEVRVIAQSQGTDTAEASDNSSAATVRNPDVPHFKPFVATVDSDTQKPAELARLIVESQRFKAFQLDYTVQGHSQNGRNWQPNAVCHVEDEVRGIKGDFLIYARTFAQSKDSGTTTALKLSRLGLRPS